MLGSAINGEILTERSENTERSASSGQITPVGSRRQMSKSVSLKMNIAHISAIISKSRYHLLVLRQY